jgi:integrase
VRTRLQLANRLRDLALFDLAIDSKLRGCDVVALKVVDVAPHGYAVDRASVRQRKTGRPVRFEITEQTRQAIDDYLCQRDAAFRAEEAEVQRPDREFESSPLRQLVPCFSREIPVSEIIAEYP